MFRKKMTIDVTKEDHRRIKVAAAKLGMTLSKCILTLMSKELDEIEKPKETERGEL